MSAPRDNDARQDVMTHMRQALGREQNTEAKQTVSARLARPPATPIPARADIEPTERIQLFIDHAKAVQADVEHLSSSADLPETIAGYLRRHNLPMRLAKAADDRLDQIDWSKSLLEIRTGRPAADDPVGLSTAFAGIAETGTLMLTSDAGHPTLLAFLPETAIIVLPSHRIARAYEDALHDFRRPGSDLPRSINLITGPSRSGDIEQTLQLGAHGPKRLLIILVDEVNAGDVITDVAAAPPAT